MISVSDYRSMQRLRMSFVYTLCTLHWNLIKCSFFINLVKLYEIIYLYLIYDSERKIIQSRYVRGIDLDSRTDILIYFIVSNRFILFCEYFCNIKYFSFPKFLFFVLFDIRFRTHEHIVTKFPSVKLCERYLCTFVENQCTVMGLLVLLKFYNTKQEIDAHWELRTESVKAW